MLNIYKAIVQVLTFLFFCLETKEAKIQGWNFLCYKFKASAKSFELASLQTANDS